MEEWKDIDGYIGLYQVSNMGRVRSLDRYARVCGNGKRLVKGRIMKPAICTNGYYEVGLSNGSRCISPRLIHRLVAQAFIPNPDNLPEVNHKDEDIKNNSVENLEWCSSKYNANYGTRNERCRDSNRKYFKPVYQIDKDCGMIIRWWECIKDAARCLNIHDEQISRVCKGKNITAGGYKWVYASDYDKQNVL